MYILYFIKDVVQYLIWCYIAFFREVQSALKERLNGAFDFGLEEPTFVDNRRETLKQARIHQITLLSTLSMLQQHRAGRLE